MKNRSSRRDFLGKMGLGTVALGMGLPAFPAEKNINIAKRRVGKSVMQNSLWNLDIYPDNPRLAPYGSIEMANFKGPGIVKTMHVTVNRPGKDVLDKVFIEITYDGNKYPSVYAPLGNFFGSSFKGKSSDFASAFLAKRPKRSLYSYFPMPFKKEVKIRLINKTDREIGGLAYVTAELIPEWDDELLYFHANWHDNNVKLPEDVVPIINTKGKGHYLGTHMTMETDYPEFKGNMGICEGNDEFYIDGENKPSWIQLGSEDYFGFSWNWKKLWHDDYSGITYVGDENGVSKLATYRFLLNDPILFSRSLKAQINYHNEPYNVQLKKAKEEGKGEVRFGIVSYWYQDKPVDATKS
ncbi:MAG: DUF2961 domain-containing protein [Chlorobi bacterium]|nr:DUF2961 domain-containing protein [Chlorobiota bacterium]